uniref:Plastocyanin-like domain-containing protein n=1 Tax=Oryza nivara TaxID=4536 RepID=A0A0E0J1F2_ORYNI
MTRCSRRLLCSLFRTAAALCGPRHDWDITYQFTSPDCVRKLAVTINGHTPSRTISVGDTIVINVKNSLLTENVTIHWHSIRQISTPWADGTGGITQRHHRGVRRRRHHSRRAAQCARLRPFRCLLLAEAGELHARRRRRGVHHFTYDGDTRTYSQWGPHWINLSQGQTGL